jgi:hypothetical protein
MRTTMDACERNYAAIVSDNWAAIQESNSSEAFGNAFYAEMQRTAPELLVLFVRPKALQYSTFVQLMHTLVQFVQDPEEFYNQVPSIWLTMHQGTGVFISAKSNGP